MARHLAVRKLSRLGNEFHLTASMAVLDLTPGNYEIGIVALLLLKRCAPDWVEGDRLRRPLHITRSTSINALATSVGKPYATIHRNIQKLIKDGLCVGTADGYAISNAKANEPRVRALLIAAHDSLIRLAEDVAEGLNLADPAEALASDLVVLTITTAIDMWLVPFEYAREPVVDWTSKMVWLAIFVANVRHITLDPELSEQWAYDPTPDELRVPITVRNIAKIARLSYGTVFRHCQNLNAQDVIRYDRGGWLLESRLLFDEQVDQGVRDLLGYYAKRLNELAAAGFDTGNPRDFYLGERPEYVALPPKWQRRNPHGEPRVHGTGTSSMVTDHG